MIKRGIFLALSLVLLVSIASFVLAAEGDAQIPNSDTTQVPDSDTDTTQTTSETSIDTDANTDDTSTDAPDENEPSLDTASSSSEATLSTGSGITPDSGLYFVEDKILSRFRDDISNREKKIAEVREMIKEDKIDSAKIALEKYKSYANNLEKEVDPDKKEKAQRSAAAIRNTIKEIETQIPEEQKKEFVTDVVSQEEKIFTAAEIAGKVKELCETLSKLDPTQYARTCKTEGDAPKWQKNLDKKLTDEQRKEAKDFFNIMSQCFRTPKECECEKITIKSFADKCSVVAPLAAKCEEGEKSACEQMDEMGDPSEDLPPHLQDVFDQLEGRYSEAQFENHFPPECQEAGANTPKECQKVMFKLNAPEECIEAAEAGRINLGGSEKEMRQACEDIMFKENAPEECVSAGIRNPKECGKLMFKENAPQECIEAGITGERSSDPKKCEKLMRELGGQMQGPNGPPQGGFGFGRDCKSIQDTNERLKCYDSISETAHSEFSNFQEGRGPPGGYPPECQEAGATSREACEKLIGEKMGNERQFYDEERRKNEEQFREQEKQRFENERQRFEDERGKQGEQFRQGPPEGYPQPGQGQYPRPPEGYPQQGQYPQGPGTQFSPDSGQYSTPPPGTESPPPSSDTGSSSGSGGSETSGSSESSAPSGGESSPPPTTGAVITGNAIAGDNNFLKYFFKVR